MSMTVEEAIGNLIKHRIGSAREVERLKKRNDEYSWFQETVDALDIALQSIEELQQYRAIGTVSEFRELKEKATAKKPKTKKYVCPNCKRTLNVTRYDTYCEICCGRLYVDWSKGKE